MKKETNGLKEGCSKILWILMVVLLCASQPCLAEQYLFVYDGQTIDLDYEIEIGVYVYGGGTLNVLNNAIVHYLVAYPGSTVNLKGGIIDQLGLAAFVDPIIGDSNVTIYGSYVSHSPESGASFKPSTNSLDIDPNAGWTGNITCIYDEPAVTAVIPVSSFTNINFTSFSEPEPLEVDIDIKPGSYPNSLNINGHGVIPVAILGSADFDVTQIDISTLSFAGLELRVKGNGVPQCSIQDVSGDFTNPEGAPDGYPDLVCQFVDDPLSWIPGDEVAELTGNLLDGTLIAGTDSIRVVQE